MTREQRWYLAIRVAVIGGLTGAVVWLWTVVQRQVVILTSGNDCGCAVAPVQWPLSVTIGTALVTLLAGIVTVRFVLAVAIRVWRNNKLSQRFHAHGRVIEYHRLHLTYVLVPDSQPQAMTIGLFQPTIVVTTTLLQRLSGSEFLSVLRHEQAHARSRDPLWSLLLEAVGQAAWWQGGLRSLVNSAFSLREVIADAAATRNYTSIAGLSGAITKLASPMPPQALPAFSPNTDRVNKLLDHAWRVPLPRLQWRSAALGVALALGLMLAGRLPAATAAAQPQLPAEACWIQQAMCAGVANPKVIFMSPTGVMSRYGW